MMPGERVFIDTNVLVYAAATSSPLHHQARTALDGDRESPAEFWISRQVIREYLAVLSRPGVYGKPVPMSQLLEDARLFEKRFRLAEDGPEVMAKLADILRRVPVGGKQVHDANIVATMLAHDVPCLLTHNTRDFIRFSDWIRVAPLEADAGPGGTRGLTPRPR